MNLKKNQTSRTRFGLIKKAAISSFFYSNQRNWLNQQVHVVSETKKPPCKAVFRRFSELPTLWTKVTGY